MLSQFRGASAAALLIALTPALLAWWRGRALSVLADDPVLPERLVAHNCVLGMVSAGCVALLAAGWGWGALWSLPLLMIAVTAAGFPLRKTLYEETWSLGAFLGFIARLRVALFGFWIILAATPWLVSHAGGFKVAVGAGLALILIAWTHHSELIVRTLLRTRPITAPSLVARFEALVSKCGIPMPRFEYVPMGGGVLANAFALPALRRSSVIVTDTLLSRLTEDETVAICAHELAHLEYYDRARLRRRSAVTILLIGTVVAAAGASRLMGGSTGLAAVGLLWICALAMQGRRRQQHETASDLRAVALTGDGEALARALIALHAIARVPRRWDRRREREATHPSLARRIRDIRAAAGGASAMLDSPAAFRAASGDTLVTFDSTRLTWNEGPGIAHVIDYAALVELRLHASAVGAVALVARERQGKRWQMTPATSDLPALQAVLDAVDGSVTHDSRVPAFSAAVTRLVASFACVLAYLIGQLPFAFVALLASVAPAPSLLAGAGAAAFTAAAVMLRAGSLVRNAAESAALLGMMGAGLLALAWVRRSETARGTVPLIGLLGFSTAVTALTIGDGGLNLIRLHQGALFVPGATVLLVALGAACSTSRNRLGLRCASVAAVFGAAAAALLGSTALLDLAGQDPFLVAARPVTWTRIEGPAIAEFDVPFYTETLRLSPNGRLAAFERAEEQEDEEDEAAPSAAAFHIGVAGGAVFPIDAADIVFVDDRRALLLVKREGAAQVRDVSFGDSALANWQEEVPDTRHPRLAYDASSRRWTVLGRSAGGGFVRTEGIVGERGSRTTAWSPLPHRRAAVTAISTNGSALLAVETRYELGALARTAPVSLRLLLSRSYSHSQMWRLGDRTPIDAGRSLLDTTCSGKVLNDRMVCTAFDGTGTRIAAIDPVTGSVMPLATIDGRVVSDDTSAPGWLSGSSGGDRFALRLTTAEGIRPPRRPHEYIYAVTATDDVLGTLSWQGEGSHIRVYPMPGVSSVLARRD